MTSNETGKHARVPLLSDAESESVSASVRIPKFVADLNIFRAVMNRPQIARQLNLLGAVLLQGDARPGPDAAKPALDPRLRELAIMRIGWQTKSVYEWTQHWRIARSIGVPADDLLAVRDWQAAEILGSEERSVLAAVDETLRGEAIGDATWAELADFLPDDALVELTVVIGHWIMVSTFLRSLHVPLEEGVEPWPPDGLEP